MGFFDTLIEFGKVAGTFAYYRSMYDEYDDETLVDEFYTLWKRKYNYSASTDDELRYTVIKSIIDTRKLFEFGEK